MNCPNLRKGKYSPPICTRDVDRRFVGVVRGFCALISGIVGNGGNTVSRILHQRRELADFSGKLGEFCEKLCEFALTDTHTHE